MMTPRLRKLALTAHIASSVGWLGAAVAYVGLVVAGFTSDDAETVRVAYRASEPITWFVLVPLAAAALVSGVAQSLGSNWGLFRHYWVLIKLLLTVSATIVLLMNTRTVTALARAAAETGTVDRTGLGGQLLHAAGGVVVLLLTTALAVYKPRGLTPYGQLKQRAER